MPSSDVEDYGAADATAAIDELRESAASASTRPVTVRQLLDATQAHSDADFEIDDIVVDRVILVAQVLRVRDQLAAQAIFYDLADGTSGGLISATQWRSDARIVLPDDEPSMYAEIIGTLHRSPLDLKNSLKVHAIHRVPAGAVADRVCYHLLEAAFVTLCFERGPPPAAVRKAACAGGLRFPSNQVNKPPVTQSAPTTQARTVQRTVRSPRPVSPATVTRRSTPDPRPRTPLQQPALQEVPRQDPRAVHYIQTPVRAGPPSPKPMRHSPRLELQPEPLQSGNTTRRVSRIKRDPYANYTVVQRAILLQIISAPPSTQGQSIPNIVNGISHYELTTSQIEDALDFLVDEGVIETTIDNNHYTMRSNHYPARI